MWPNQLSSKLLINALEHVQRPDDHLNDMLVRNLFKNSSKSERMSLELFQFDFRLASANGFEQFGSLFGQVTIDSGDNREIYEMNLPGVRINRKLDVKPREIWQLMASCKDGCVVSMLAQRIENEYK